MMIDAIFLFIHLLTLRVLSLMFFLSTIQKVHGLEMLSALSIINFLYYLLVIHWRVVLLLS